MWLNIVVECGCVPCCSAWHAGLEEIGPAVVAVPTVLSEAPGSNGMLGADGERMC